MKLFFTLLCFCAAVMLAADAIEFTAPPELRDGRWLKKIAVTQGNGVVRCNAVTEQPGVSYVSFRLPCKPFSLNGKALLLTVCTQAPKETTGFYVRALDAENRIIASFQGWGMLKSTPRKLLLVPGASGAMSWEKDMIQADPAAPVAKLLIYLAARDPGKRIQAELSQWAVVDAPAAGKTAERFENLGTAASSAELRSLIAATDAAGRRIVLTRPQDHGGRGYLLLTDVENGKTVQYFAPDAAPQGDTFGSILSSRGKYYFDYPVGKVLEFDINTRAFRLLGVPDKEARHFMVYTEGADGKIWMGSYPNAAVSMWDPATETFRSFGRMDAREAYVDSIAVDRTGTVYCGIGSARANLTALDPRTGAVTQILPEELRATGYGKVFAAVDGSVHASFGKFRARLLGGKVVERNPTPAEKAPNRAAKYMEQRRYFSDGSQLLLCDLYRKELTIREKNGSLRRLPFDFLSGGLEITALAAGPDGNIYGSSCHPMHFIAIDGQSGKITDHGPNPVVGGGNFCNLTAAANGKLYACEYAGGRLWEYDPGLPVDQGGEARYGLSPQELAAVGGSGDGKLIALSAPTILFCCGDGTTAEFRFRIPADGDKPLYLNLLPYRSADYGIVTFSSGKLSRTVDLRHSANAEAAPIALGPLTPKNGALELVCTVKRHPDGKAWFGLAGAQAARKPLQTLEPRKELNPRQVGRWRDSVTRPRAILAHPDGKHIIMSGFANYGLNGGGFGIRNLETGENETIEHPVPDQSCIALVALPNGDLFGGTSCNAPGGGVRRAAEGALFRFDWNVRKTVRVLPLPGNAEVPALALWHGRIVAGLSGGELIAVDPETMEIVARHDISAWGKIPRNALQQSADGRLFLLQGQGISELNAKTFEPEYLAMPPHSISAGGAIRGGWLYLGCWTQAFRFRLPDVKEKN